jgi:hypothetical protein
MRYRLPVRGRHTAKTRLQPHRKCAGLLHPDRTQPRIRAARPMGRQRGGLARMPAAGPRYSPARPMMPARSSAEQFSCGF